MTIKIRIIIALILLSAMIYVIYSIFRKKLDVKYALPWFFMLIALAILDSFPSLLIVLTGALGISAPINMLFFFGFCFSLMIIFYLTSIIYNISNRLRKVAQELALLQKELHEKDTYKNKKDE